LFRSCLSKSNGKEFQIPSLVSSSVVKMKQMMAPGTTQLIAPSRYQWRLFPARGALAHTSYSSEPTAMNAYKNRPWFYCRGGIPSISLNSLTLQYSRSVVLSSFFFLFIYRFVSIYVLLMIAYFQYAFSSSSSSTSSSASTSSSSLSFADN